MENFIEENCLISPFAHGGPSYSKVSVKISAFRKLVCY